MTLTVPLLLPVQLDSLLAKTSQITEVQCGNPLHLSLFGPPNAVRSTKEREKALFGVFVPLALPFGPLLKEAAAVGMWENEYTGRKHRRLQIPTLAELFQGKRPDITWVDASVLKSAKREDTNKQGQLI